jgi:hypothetical protein
MKYHFEFEADDVLVLRAGLGSLVHRQAQNTSLRFENQIDAQNRAARKTEMEQEFVKRFPKKRKKGQPILVTLPQGVEHGRNR